METTIETKGFLVGGIPKRKLSKYFVGNPIIFNRETIKDLNGFIMCLPMMNYVKDVNLAFKSLLHRFNLVNLPKSQPSKSHNPFVELYDILYEVHEQPDAGELFMNVCTISDTHIMFTT